MNQRELNDALIQAADCDLESAKELLDAGANPNGMPLIMAIQCGAEDIVSLFIKAGVDLTNEFVQKFLFHLTFVLIHVF